MKKHIIGLALFSFIVSAATVIYALFNVPEIITVSAPQYIPTQRTNCKMKRELKESKSNSPLITQAVFNLKTKQFSWELARQKVNSPILLHFFIKDEKGTSYISTEQGINSVRYGEMFFSGSFIWIGNLDSYMNLYVIAELAPTPGHYKNYQPEFNADKAIPVLLDYGQ